MIPQRWRSRDSQRMLAKSILAFAGLVGVALVVVLAVAIVQTGGWLTLLVVVGGLGFVFALVWAGVTI